MKPERGYWEGDTSNFTWERAKQWHEERSRMTTTQLPDFRPVPLSALVLSQTRMQVERRAYRTKDDIRELAESIRSVGVIHPILARPYAFREVSEERYEIVAGEGRYLAAKEAGLEQIDVAVRELTDEQVEEIQLIENLQRKDLHELIEAEGFDQLMKRGHSPEEIATRIGKSKRTVYARIQLLKLQPDVRELFRRGELDYSKAFLISRLPLPTQQREAAKAIQVDGMSFREAKAYIERDFMLDLKSAPFPTDDAQLLKNTPSCGRCTKRTGNQPELFEDVRGADVCTDRTCYQAKCVAGGKLKLALARANGQKVIAGAEAKMVKRWEYSSQLAGGYAEPADTCYDDPKQRTYAQILGKDYKPAVLEDPYQKGVVIEVVQKQDAIAVLKKAGVIKPAKKPASTRASSSGSDSKQDGKREQRERFALALFTAICAKVDRLERWTLDEMARRELHAGLSDEIRSAVGLKGSQKEMEKQIGKLSDADLQKLFLASLADMEFGGFNTKPTTLLDFAKRYKVNAEKVKTDLAAVDKAAREAAKEATKASKKKAARK